MVATSQDGAAIQDGPGGPRGESSERIRNRPRECECQPGEHGQNCPRDERDVRFNAGKHSRIGDGRRHRVSDAERSSHDAATAARPIRPARVPGKCSRRSNPVAPEQHFRRRLQIAKEHLLHFASKWFVLYHYVQLAIPEPAGDVEVGRSERLSATAVFA